MSRRRSHPSLNVIAREIGVSPATISRVLNGKPGIAEGTRRKVLDALTERGYPKTSVRGGAQTLRNGSGTIAYAISNELRQRLEKGDPFYVRHLVAIQTACSEFGFYPILIDYEQDATPDGNLRCVEEQRVFGVVAEWMDESLVKTLRGHIGVVLLNGLRPVSGVDYIIPDIRRAVQEQVDHLYELGHRSIACFRPLPSRGWQSGYYWSEFWAQVQKYGLHQPGEFFEPIQFSIDEEGRAIQEFIDRVFSIAKPPTAIVTHDSYARIFIRELEARGKRIPQDVSIVGFDDRDTDPYIPLSTHRQNFNGMAREALRTLMDRCANADLPSRVIEVEGQTIWRDSVGPVPGNRA